MYECIQVGQDTFYLDSPSKVGVYRHGECGWLIDSGSDRDGAKKALAALEALGLRLEAAVVTHYHADHTGGAALLQQRTGCRLLIAQPLAPAAYPEINTALLYGAHPPKPLRGKFFLAPQADYEDAEQAALPEGMELVRLDGHAFAMLGVRTPDGVWFIGDSLAGEKTLEKYKLTYLYDVEKYLRSLERVSTLQGELFVSAHPEPVRDVSALVEINRRWVEQTADFLCEALRTPTCPDELLKRVFDHYGLEMTFGQYALLGATVRAFLTYLMDEGRVQCQFQDNRLFWYSQPQADKT